MADDQDTDEKQFPKGAKGSKVGRTALQILGSTPIVGGLFSAVAGAWSEQEQTRVNEFFQAWVRMLEDEIKEKEATLIEILARIDLQDEKVQERVSSKEYQSLLKKTFREWAGAESEAKRRMIRNILANAAGTQVTSDDVIRMFIDWLKNYSELHFEVIGAVYNSGGISRGEIWRKIGKGQVREDSADADLYKLLFRDLSTGSVIRQERMTDYYGNFVAKPKRHTPKGGGSTTMKSAFDEEEKYVLTELGSQFVHYALTDLPPRIEYTDPMSNYN